MEKYLVLGAVILVALLIFKFVGKVIKIILLILLAAAAVFYFTGGDLSGLHLPSFKR